MGAPKNESHATRLTADELRAENEALLTRLEKAEETLRAIRSGAVDAFVAGEADRRQGYTLDGADRVYRVWIEQMSQGAATLSVAGTIVYGNPRLAALVGVPVEKLAGRPFRDFIPDPERPAFDALWREAQAGASHSETRLARPGSEVVPVYLTLSRLPAESGTAVGVLVTDLTEQVRASETRFRSLVEQVKDYAIFLTDREGRATSWNEGVKRVLGFDEAEFVGADISSVIFTPEDVAAGVPEQELATAAATSTANDDRWMRRKDGTRFWAMGITTALHDPSGNLLGFTKVMRDQTDWKRTEDHLRESELRYRLVADASNDVIWDWDLLTNEVAWNEGVQTCFGYPAEAIRADAAWWGEHIHPEDVEHVTHSIHEHIHHGPDQWEGEYRFRREDGSYAAVFDRGRVVRDKTGTPVRMVGSMLDLTERKRAAAALRAAEERFAFVRESSGVGFWYCDLPFDVLEWDERVKEHFHLPPDARVTLHTFYDHIHPEDREPIRVAIEHTIAEQTPYDVTYRTVDTGTGAEKWVRAIGRTVYAPDGTPTRFDGVTVEVTHQKRVEEDLARSLRKEQRQAETLARVAQASRSINAVLSVESITRILTGEARTILGARLSATTYTADDCSPAAQTFSSTNEDTAARAEFERVLASGLAEEVCRTNRPVRIETSDGFGVLAVPLTGHGGQNIGLVSVIDGLQGDFTDDDEAILTQLAAIAAVGIENARLYERLRDQDRRKDEFLATLAHELRNPLAPIRNGLSVLRLGKAREAGERVVGMMERQLGLLVHLVDDLLDVSRVTSGKITLRTERVELRAVVDAAVETSRPPIEQAGHRLTVSLADETLPLDADRTRLAQVVTNLLNNAAKYTPEGGRIDLSATRQGDEAVLRVADTGIGIPAEMLPKVFDVFTQVGRSMDRAQGGLGLGLALVRKLVEMHGGRAWAESPGAGHGSTFFVRLPLARGPARQIQSGDLVDSGPEAVDTPRRVLIVDDNADAADSLAMLLGLAGHQTETAYSGPAAVTAAKAFRPEVVFLDIGLPGMSGYDVAKAFRADPSLSKTVLVALTGWGTDDDQRRAKEAGFDFHLTKPAEAEKVETLLAKLAPGNSQKGSF